MNKLELASAWALFVAVTLATRHKTMTDLKHSELTNVKHSELKAWLLSLALKARKKGDLELSNQLVVKALNYEDEAILLEEQSKTAHDYERRNGSLLNGDFD